MIPDADFSPVDLVPDFPTRPKREISRDSLIRWITSEFGPSCPKQIIASGPLSGKTNFLSQFALYHRNSAVSYFVNSNPLTQDLRTFLFVVCNQIGKLLGRPNVSESIRLEELKSIFPGLAMSLAEQSKKTRTRYFFVIDGLEWASLGEKGNRIIDYPLSSFAGSPYLLFSCRLDQRGKLPLDGFEVRDSMSHHLEFNLTDTQEYLSDLDLEFNLVQMIHERARGLPGYIKIIRDTILASDSSWIETNELPSTLENLIDRQLNIVYQGTTEQIADAIKYVAVAPKPMSIDFLASNFDTDARGLLDSLLSTALISYDPVTKCVQISSELTRDVILSRLGSKKKEISSVLLERAKDAAEQDDLLVTLLMKDASDYDGISTKLENDNILASYGQTRNLSNTSRALHIAAEMAYQAKDILGLVRWNLKRLTAESVLSHAVNYAEISALIAVGESEAARERAYALPDSISKMRLLARAYAVMKERGERVAKNAVEELQVLLMNQNLQEYDKATLQDLAIDLFPILPDRAVAILENRFNQQNEVPVIEFAIQETEEYSDRHGGMRPKEIANVQLGYFFKMHAAWLRKLHLVRLIGELEELRSTSAKEFLVRQWCTQNLESPELDQGVQLWIDTVVADNSFSIPLRSLRKISGILKEVNAEYQLKLIYRLEIPSFNSIRTPWEEWIGFQLNLAEALYKHDAKEAKHRIDRIYETINLEVHDYNVRVFCYARLWATVAKYYQDLEQPIKLNLERVLSSLLRDAALHDEILNQTLQVIAPIDIEYALEKALEMNTVHRRSIARKVILKASLRKRPDRDISTPIENVLKSLDETEQARLVRDLCHEIWRRNTRLSDENQSTLLRFARKIPDPAQKADTLAYLTASWSNEKLIRKAKLVNEVQKAWGEEDDLTMKIRLGFDVVERLAEVDKQAAKGFLRAVQDLYLLPGGALASGDLSQTFIQTIEAAILSLNLRALSVENGPVDLIMGLLERFPSARVRTMLYAQLAARAFTEGYAKKGEEVVRKRVLPGIESLSNRFDRFFVIRFAFPVLYKYDKTTAIDLSTDLPESYRERCWISAAIWSLVMGDLGSEMNIEHLKVQADYPTIKNYAVDAVANLSVDVNLYFSIIGISKVIEQSVKAQKLDVTQAYALLHSLDELVEQKLPDSNNIAHEGYLIACQATIQGARSLVHKVTPKKGALSRAEIREKWEKLEDAARRISNTADRVFVMEIVASEMFKHNDERAVILLEDAEKFMNSIPAIVDRADRFEAIGKAWNVFGRKDLATFTMEKALKLVNQMGDSSKDRKLEMLVQAAYKLNPEFSEKLVADYDSRFPDEILSPLRISHETQKLIHHPESIIRLSSNQKASYLRFILGECATQQYNDLLVGHGRIPDQSTLLEWARQGGRLDSDTFLKISAWLQECIRDQFLSHELTMIFVDLASFILKFTAHVSPAKYEGIPDEIINILPGFSSKVIVFRVGEYEKAKKWLDDWIKQHAQEYLKIVDPYFSPEQVTFLANVPKNCKVLVITTDKYFREFDSAKRVEAQLEHVWNQFGKGAPPQTNVIIVPESQTELFHDRVMVSKNRGLDLGQSLNGIGRKVGKITDLPEEDAKELEAKYVDNLLNHNTWFITRDIQPTIVRMGYNS